MLVFDHADLIPMKSSLLFIFFYPLITITAFGQRASQRSPAYKPAEIHKMPVVLIDLQEKSYPRSYLQKVTATSVMIIKKTMHERTLQPMYFTGEIALDQIESITLVSRKRKWRTNLIGAAVGGTAGYFIGRQFKPEPLSQANIELLNQPPRNGFIEPILGSLIGLGVGIVVGDLFTPLRIDNVSQNPRKAIASLSEYAPSRRSVKNRKRR